MSRRALVLGLWLSATGGATGLVATAVRMAVVGVASPGAPSDPANGGFGPSRDGRGPVLAAAATGERGPRPSPTAASPAGPPGGANGTGSPNRPNGNHAAVAVAGARPPAMQSTGSAVPGVRTSSQATSTTGPGTGASSPQSTTTTPPAGPSGTTTTTVPTTTTTTTSQVFSYTMRGGSVGIRCNVNQVSLAYATPDNGYSVEVDSSGPNEVAVRFIQSSSTTTFRSTCQDGQPQPSITSS